MDNSPLSVMKLLEMSSSYKTRKSNCEKFIKEITSRRGQFSARSVKILSSPFPGRITWNKLQLKGAFSWWATEPDWNLPWSAYGWLWGSDAESCSLAVTTSYWTSRSHCGTDIQWSPVHNVLGADLKTSRVFVVEDQWQQNIPSLWDWGVCFWFCGSTSDCYVCHHHGHLPIPPSICSQRQS